MPNSRKTPTIQDVARFAKVSTATVSRALSQPAKVSEATRTRVSEAVEVTGYTLNQAARSLRQRTARTILVALPDIRNTFFSTILDAIEREAATRGYGVLVVNRFAGAESGRRLHEYFLSNRADGLLLLDGTVDLAQLLVLSAEPSNVPLVMACETIPGAPFHTVRTDNAYAARVATRHLIAQGHTRIGHILGPAGNVLTAEREAGFRTALAASGLATRPDWVLTGGFEMEHGLAAAERFLALSDRPSAVFAANDESAIGFLSGIRRLGLECPRDVSVVGFDDVAVSAHFWPPLTTMRQPREALGRLAAEELIDLIEGKPPRSVPQHTVLSSELIVRGSTLPAPIESASISVQTQ
ncbi:LacI family DNA-binding transcriptional regulator [Devosia neptuniae]|jgi:LacI family repressor for deo operon, udp, cdd, tsx, nupC, and nupG|nr:LacI family DNA-binding transcriptional regulator [Devosia neptuniae]MCZ4346266.1 LacI family DNA-binding transcriptional regulator [Devosia neptuniae]|tara:strand:+ start:35962 stop:37026 length:1065 start_codon:yes stop_codon:yes gene_type:complete